MNITFLPIHPNPRARYHNKVQSVAEMLYNYRTPYLFDIAGFITSFNSQTYHDGSLNNNYKICQIKRRNPADVNFIKLIEELDKIYTDKSQLDNLRGAVLEIFIFSACKNKHGLSNVYVETFIQIDNWKSSSTIDVGAYVKGKIGECFECKVDTQFRVNKKRKLKQQLNLLKDIMKRTNNKIQGVIATFADKSAFEVALSRPPLNFSLDKVVVFGRTQLINL